MIGDLGSKRAADPIYAEIVGSDFCEAEGIAVRSAAPVLELCRELVAAGHDPARPLVAYRGHTPCLIVRSIGEAAGLEINAKGTDFARYRGVRTASQARKNRPAAIEAGP